MNKETIGFADCWLEVRIAYHRWRTKKNRRNVTARIHHQIASTTLELRRKSCMERALAEMRAAQ